MLRRVFRQLGPALILAAVVLGPGSITLATMAGSSYQYRLLWVVVLATVFMIAFSLMAARVSLVTGMTLLDISRRKYGRLIAQCGGVFGFLSILAFQVGNTAAVALSGEALFSLPATLWAFVFVAAAALLLFQKDLIRRLEVIVKICVGAMILGFVSTLVLVGADLPALGRGLVPGFPNPDSVFLALGMAATTFSVPAAVYQGYLMVEKKWKLEALEARGLDVLAGIGVLGSITAVILLTSARVLHGSGVQVVSAQSMALQLEPLAGAGAFYLFTIGFFFAAVSSLIVNPLVGAALLADAFGARPTMEGRAVKLLALGILGLALLIFSFSVGSPIQILRTAQALAVVALPVLGLLLWLAARNRDLMGAYANPRWLDLLAALGYLTVLGIAVNYLRPLLF